MVQEKVGQTQSCCQVAQIPARGRGCTALCQSAPILKDVFTRKEENAMTEEQQTRQKREIVGKSERAEFSGRKEERTQKQARVSPRRGGFQGDGKGSRMSDCSQRHREGF